MLILARKKNECIMIGDQIEISIIDIKRDQVKIGIKAPENIKVYRQEVYMAIQQENIEAVKSHPVKLPEFSDLFRLDSNNSKTIENDEKANEENNE